MAESLIGSVVAAPVREPTETLEHVKEAADAQPSRNAHSDRPAYSRSFRLPTLVPACMFCPLALVVGPPALCREVGLYLECHTPQRLTVSTSGQ